MMRVPGESKDSALLKVHRHAQKESDGRETLRLSNPAAKSGHGI